MGVACRWFLGMASWGDESGVCGERAWRLAICANENIDDIRLQVRAVVGVGKSNHAIEDCYSLYLAMIGHSCRMEIVIFNVLDVATESSMNPTWYSKL